MMGYGPEDKNAVLELTYNYGVTEYDKGNAYAQVETSSFSLFLSNMLGRRFRFSQHARYCTACFLFPFNADTHTHICTDTYRY